MPESIRDDSSSVTMDVNDDGSINTNNFNDGVIVSSANPLPVDVKNAEIEVVVDIDDKITVAPLNVAVIGTKLVIGTTATQIPASTFSERKSISVKNNSTPVVFIGHGTVSSTNGYPLDQVESMDIDLGTTSVIYGITISTVGEARVLEFS